MKTISTLLAFALIAALPTAAQAQDGAKKRGHRKEALLKKFDKDGDGKLNEAERAAARDFKEKRRGEEKRGLRRKVLKRFDSNGDRKLDEAEREALKKFLDSHGRKGGKKRSRR